MKRIVLLTLFLTSLCLFEVQAQQPGDSRPLASHNSAKGKRELRREKKVKRNSHKKIRHNERKAKEQQEDVNNSRHKIRKPKNQEKKRTFFTRSNKKESKEE